MLASINYLAELTGLDRRKVTVALRDLPSTPGAHRARQYESRDALRILYAAPGGDGNLNPSQERARLDRVRADLAELDLARRRGELLPAAEVVAAWSEQVAIAKGRMLAIPARVAPGMIRCRDLRSAERMLKDAIYTVLEELANDAASYGLPPEGEAPPDPSAA